MHCHHRVHGAGILLLAHDGQWPRTETQHSLDCVEGKRRLNYCLIHQIGVRFNKKVGFVNVVFVVPAGEKNDGPEEERTRFLDSLNWHSGVYDRDMRMK